MTVHINGSKGKDLYCGGTKIKEAYYNGNKVYSSRPLYYCYRGLSGGTYLYYYFSQKPTSAGSITYYMKQAYFPVQVSESSELTYSAVDSIIDVTASQFKWSQNPSLTMEYYQSGDLYT